MNSKRYFWAAAILSFGIHGAAFGFLWLAVSLGNPDTPPMLLMVYGDSDRPGLSVEAVVLDPGTLRQGAERTPGGDGQRKTSESTPPPIKPVVFKKPASEPVTKAVHPLGPVVVEKAPPSVPAAIQVPVASPTDPNQRPARETSATVSKPAPGGSGLPGAPGGSRFPLGTPSAGGTVGGRSGVLLDEGASPPPYPPEAREAGIEGTPVIWLRISAQGKVLEARIHKSCGYRILDNAALEWARVQKFVPAQRDNVPVEAEATKPVRFYLY